jgi:hypothetical protein
MTWGIFKTDIVSEAYKKMKAEELKGKQHKLDVNKNGKIDGEDLAKLRKEDAVEEGWNDMLKDVEKRKKEADAADKFDKKKVSTGTVYSRKPSKDADSKTQKNEEVELEEAINADDYKVTSEPSQFGGHRPKVVHKEKGTTMHLSQHAYKSPKHAEEHAKAYLTAYEKRGPNAADSAGHDYAKQNKQHTVVKEDVDYIVSEEKQPEIVKSKAKEIKHANMKDKQDDAEVMEPHSQGEADFIDKHVVRVTDDPAAEYKPGSDKVKSATKPSGKGPGSYNGDSKLSDKDKATYKEGASVEEECSSKKKTFSTFKKQMKD